MKYTVIMLFGIWLGARILPEKLQKKNGKLQILITILLLFTMGVSFGSQPDFFYNIQTAGVKSLLYAIFSIFGSVIVVCLLAKLLLKEKKSW